MWLVNGLTVLLRRRRGGSWRRREIRRIEVLTILSLRSTYALIWLLFVQSSVFSLVIPSPADVFALPTPPNRASSSLTSSLLWFALSLSRLLLFKRVHVLVFSNLLQFELTGIKPPIWRISLQFLELSNRHFWVICYGFRNKLRRLTLWWSPMVYNEAL